MECCLSCSGGEEKEASTDDFLYKEALWQSREKTSYRQKKRNYKTWLKITVGEFFALANFMKQHASRRGKKKRTYGKGCKRDAEENRDLRIRKDKKDPGRSRGNLKYQVPLTSQWYTDSRLRSF